MAGEFDFIEWIRQQTVARHGARVLVPPGDDLAALRWSTAADDLLIVGADQVLDGVHFDAAVHAPRDIGRKVMNRNLSDCAAMACLPAAAVATVALPRDRGIDYAKELFLGMKAAADAFDFPIVGGDTASWDGRLALTVTILGRSAGIGPITRGGAKPGNSLWVTGPLGGSILGRHMTFTPRVTEGRILGACPHVTAMIDLSDGLSRDLRHICRASNVGAIVLEEQLPIHPDVARMKPDGRSATEHALSDGEDHELLVAIDCVVEELPYELEPVGLRFIGTIEQGDQILLGRTDGGLVPLEPRGWEHRL